MLQSVSKLVLLSTMALAIGCMLVHPMSRPRGDAEPSANAANDTLSNLLQPAESVFSGGEPVGAEAFAAIAALGVHTIVSVDGVPPQVDEAAKHGLRYVHIPIGYDGVDQPARLSLVKLTQESSEPIYVHCHHGRHRGPAAAAIVCRALGVLDQAEALAFLQQAGTDPAYSGLYRDVRNFQMPDASIALPQLVSHAEVATLAEQMARIDRLFERLQAGIRSDMDSILLLQEFKEATRSLDASEMHDQMQAAESYARQLHESINDDDAAEKALNQLNEACTRCHQAFRDY